MSTLPCRDCLALSTFLSLSLSCSRLAPLDGVVLPPFTRTGRLADEPLLLDAGVIFVWQEELESGRDR